MKKPVVIRSTKKNANYLKTAKGYDEKCVLLLSKPNISYNALTRKYNKFAGKTGSCKEIYNAKRSLANHSRKSLKHLLISKNYRVS